MVLAALVGAAVASAGYLLMVPVIYIMMRDVASPLTISIVYAAAIGLGYTSLIRPGEELSGIEKIGVIAAGAVTGGFISYNNGLPSMSNVGGM